jgi:hypothetical protein
MRYEAYLELVKQDCSEFREVQDLVTRYSTLETSNQDLLKQQSLYEKKVTILAFLTDWQISNPSLIKDKLARSSGELEKLEELARPPSERNGKLTSAASEKFFTIFIVFSFCSVDGV